jgi:hypothetical protein
MKKLIPVFLTVLIVANGSAAHANDMSAISQNIIDSVANVPGLISGGSYLLGLLLGIMGIIKLKQHVENPNQVELKESMIRFIVGGALFALPIVYEAAATTIDPTGEALTGGILGDIENNAAGFMNLGVGNGNGNDLNSVFQNIITSLQDVPGLFSGGSYLLGLVFGVSAILTFRDHVLNPQQTELRLGVNKMLAAGALFGLPVVFEAMYNTISLGANPDGGNLSTLISTMGIPTEGGNGCANAAGNATANSIGGVICNAYTHSGAFPVFMSACAYLFGIVLGIWGILKIKEHVANPAQTPIWEGLSRLIAGGAMFALPTSISAVYTTISAAINDHINTGFNEAGATGNGLDQMLVLFTTSMFGPMSVLLNFFGYAAGIVLVMIGIMRLMKSAQEGVRGPGGIGTIMTFVTGGALLSFSPMIAAFSVSLFGADQTTTMGALTYTAGLQPAELGHINAVVAAIIKFVLILGLVSFLRGIFIVRAVAEGSQQASMMAGVTHLVGGALAVNLGPLLNAIQATLGLTDYGVNFT